MMICICSQFCKGFAYGNKDDMCNKDLFVYSRLHCWTSQSPSSRHAFIDGFSMIFHYKPSLLGTTIYENLHIVDRKNHLCDGQTHMWKDDPSASYRSTTSSCSWGGTEKTGMGVFFKTQMLHVWNIYTHLPQQWPKCRSIFQTWSIWGRENYRNSSDHHVDVLFPSVHWFIEGFETTPLTTGKWWYMVDQTGPLIFTKRTLLDHHVRNIWHISRWKILLMADGPLIHHT